MIIRFAPPPKDVPAYAFRIKLDGREYRFTFRWNSRTDSWSFDLATDAGTVLLAGQKVRIGRNLIFRCKAADKPPGGLWAIAADGKRDLPTRAQLGERVRLYYFSKDETFELEPV
jgi:hypothetical protein